MQLIINVLQNGKWIPARKTAADSLQAAKEMTFYT